MLTLATVTAQVGQSIRLCDPSVLLRPELGCGPRPGTHPTAAGPGRSLTAVSRRGIRTVMTQAGSDLFRCMVVDHDFVVDLDEGTTKIAASCFCLARPCRRICAASNPAHPVQNLDSPSSPPEPLVPGALRRPKTGYSGSGSNSAARKSSDVQTQRGLSDMSVAAQSGG